MSAFDLYNKPAYDLFKKTCDYVTKHNSVIIECGGHDGTDTLKLKEEFKIPVYSIEANKDLYNKFLVNIHDPDVHVYNFGLSDIDGEKTFFIDTDPRGNAGASSFLKADFLRLPHLSHIEIPIVVPVKTLNTFISENNIENVHLLWLDVEQHEYEILSACSDETLSKIKYIYVETNCQEFRVGGKLVKDIINFMENKNFKLIGDLPQGGVDWQINLLFSNQ